jgi:hypothetical protein
MYTLLSYHVGMYDNESIPVQESRYIDKLERNLMKYCRELMGNDRSRFICMSNKTHDERQKPE